MRDNAMKKKLAAGEPAIGLWAGLDSAMAYEIAAQVDFDWILIDCEHGEASYDALPGLLRALSQSSATSLVRVPCADNLSIFKRVLDAGVEGVMVPQVYTAEEVTRVVRACRYPPQGTRGISAGRAHKYGVDFDDTFARSNNEIMIIAQIETAEAIDNIDDIMQVEGLDGVLVGPDDLSAALGTNFDLNAPVFTEAVDTVLASAKRHGKAPGIYCGDPVTAKARIAQGFQFVNVGYDASYLLDGYTKNLKEARGG